MSNNGKVALPAKPEIEEALLGSVLVGGRATFNELSLTPDDFYVERHAEIWQAMAAVPTIDVLTVSDWLDERGKLALVGGASYLAHLLTTSYTTSYADEYAEIVRQEARRRKLAETGQKMVAQACAGGDPDKITNESMRDLAAIHATGATGDGFIMWQESFDWWSNYQFEQYARLQSGAPRLLLPWHSLSWVEELEPGLLSVIAAAKGTGKTIFLECCADAWTRSGFNIAFFEYDYGMGQLGDRRMARWSGEPLSVVRRRLMTPAMEAAEAEHRKWPGAIHYGHKKDTTSANGMSIDDIVREVRRLHMEHPLDVVIVDYFQRAKFTTEFHGRNYAQVVGAEFEKLKELAGSESLHVVVASQINRAEQGKERKTATGIRDSGEVEEKANLVITLSRDVLSAPLRVGDRLCRIGELSPLMTVRVDRQNFGGTGEEQLVVIGERFAMFDKEPEPTR